jgi:hypothetical protein
VSNLIERLEALAEKATPRPWVARPDAPFDVLTEWEDGRRGQLVVCEHAGPDAEFIAATVNALPDLLALARAAKVLDDGPALGGRLAANLHDALEPLFREERAAMGER